MPFKDLREYMAKLEAEGELLHIEEEVDWNLEVGAIIRRCYDLGAPAPLFENIKGYPRGFRILGAPAGASASGVRFYARTAISLGLPPEAGAAAIIEEFVRAKHLKPVKPKLVDTAVCQENVQIGDEVNLLKFPVPYIHSGDGGRYIGTWHIVATRDPDTGWVNWGMYRLMVHDEKTMGGIILPSQHIGMHYYEKYEARNQPMPFAVAIGTEPVTSLMASAGVPAGVDEVEVIGAVRGRLLEVVKCRTVDLTVPATSEIVIEGEVPPHERRAEGPLGEYSGYQISTYDGKPVYKVSAVTHRHDPILPVACPGVPPDEHLSLTLIWSADILDALRTLGYPVKMAFVPPYAALHLVVISTETRLPNIAKEIAHATWATKTGRMIPKIMVVDSDIDVTDFDQVFWAFCTRNHPDKGIFKVIDTSTFPLWAFLAPNEKRDMTAPNVLFDCTWPKNWPEGYMPRKASFDSLWPEEVQERVLSRWGKYGYSR